ncbi:MAG: NAD(P)-binding protein [Methanobacterium sp. ERen5]|nr:MAG: NAD(P)-binding protein [Methanobacterium sp. ERen5]
MNVLVVGSGAAGGTVARELSKNGISVTIIEKGPAIKVKNAYKEYIIQNVGTEISNTVCLGGTTLVTLGNGMKDCADDSESFAIAVLKDLRKSLPSLPRLSSELLLFSNSNVNKLDKTPINDMKFIQHAIDIGLGEMPTQICYNNVPNSIKECLTDYFKYSSIL